VGIVPPEARDRAHPVALHRRGQHVQHPVDRQRGDGRGQRAAQSRLEHRGDEPHQHGHGDPHRRRRGRAEVEHRGHRPRHAHLARPGEPRERIGGPGRDPGHRPAGVGTGGHRRQREPARHRQAGPGPRGGHHPGDRLRRQRDRRRQRHRRVHRPRAGQPRPEQQRVGGQPGRPGRHRLTQQQQPGDHRHPERERQHRAPPQGEVRERPRRRRHDGRADRRQPRAAAQPPRQGRDAQDEHHAGHRGERIEHRRERAAGQAQQQRGEGVIGVRVEELRVGGLTHRGEVGDAGPPGLGDEPRGAAVEDRVPPLGDRREPAGRHEHLDGGDRGQDDDDEVAHPRARPATAGLVVVALSPGPPARHPGTHPSRDADGGRAGERDERRHPGRDRAPADVGGRGDRGAHRHHRQGEGGPGRHRLPPSGARRQADRRARQDEQRERGREQQGGHRAQRTRKITVRWTMKLVTVATPWAMT
jgi:hypothetical protein